MEEQKKYPPETLNAFEKIRRGTVEIIPEGALLTRLERSGREKRPLLIKAGFDPTAPDLHLGHIVLLRKLRHFQELGHTVLFLIGDFTGMIGDPTGRSSTRVRLTREDVLKNAKTYRDQVERILDPARMKIVFNSEWCSKMTFEDVLGLTAHYTVARMVEREDFSKRLAANESISLIEFLYPLIQGYDSVVMKADVEIGGNDQKFNLLVGRELQKEYGQEPQIIITMPLLIGLDGQKKMSKSYGNYIAVNDTPYGMFAKIMSISDDLMWDYFILLTDIHLNELDALKNDPFVAKKRLAVEIIDSLHGKGKGDGARTQWESEKGGAGRGKMVLPPDAAHLTIEAKMPCDIPLSRLLVDAGIEKSTSAVRRLIESGAIKIGEDLSTVTDTEHRLAFPGEYAIRVGKKKYLIVKG
jgi:tyrosyl-tRNA synthetase